jgi:hypothetical protein
LHYIAPSLLWAKILRLKILRISQRVSKQDPPEDTAMLFILMITFTATISGLLMDIVIILYEEIKASYRTCALVSKGWIKWQ